MDRSARMADAASRGDVDGVFAQLKDGLLPQEDDCSEALKHSRTAMETLAADEPKKLIEFLFSKMLVFQGALLLRAQRHVDDLIQQDDKKYRVGDLPSAVADVWLPRVAKIQSEVRETSRTFAAVLHTLALADTNNTEKRKPPRPELRLVKKPLKHEAANG
jgi:hypothetical protein